MTAGAVRAAAGRMLDLARRGALTGLTLDESHIEATVDLVIAVTREAYPTRDIPFHARWRHFVVGGRDLWGEVIGTTAWINARARLAAAADLAIVSVLLDAGAGAGWRYRDAASVLAIGRSEGLALASLAMFRAGAFSAVPADPLRADASALSRLSAAALAEGFQASADNPLVGLEGRAALLRRLGDTLATRFGPAARPGDLAVDLASRGAVAAPDILRAVLDRLGPIWPDRPGAVPGCGDCWRHPLLAEPIPFHKLSQWLSYSLIEPLRDAGVAVTDVDGLTGLPEYRNGGLFLDMGVLRLKDEADASRVHDVGSPLVVEWRALTVALLDIVAQRMRARLGLDAAALPLAKVLEGGTWAAGRRIARERRAEGGPPLTIASDGTVF